MNGKSTATFIAVISGAGLGYLGSCVVQPEAKQMPPQIEHIDATLSLEHQQLLDVVVRQRPPTPPDAHSHHAALAAGLKGPLPSEGNGSSPRQGG